MQLIRPIYEGQFSSSGGGGVPVSASITGATNPTITNVPMAAANTEYSYALPAGTKKFYIKLREALPHIKLAYNAGESGTTYVTVPAGNFWSDDQLTTTAITLYFQSNVAGQVAEIVSWV